MYILKRALIKDIRDHKEYFTNVLVLSKEQVIDLNNVIDLSNRKHYIVSVVKHFSRVKAPTK